MCSLKDNRLSYLGTFHSRNSISTIEIQYNKVVRGCVSVVYLVMISSGEVALCS